MKIIKYVKHEIFTMSYDRALGCKKLERYSDALADHICKCILHSDNPAKTKWINKEISVWLQYASTVKFKHQKMKPRDYLNTIFSSMGDERCDAGVCLSLTELECHHKCNPPYPEVDITDNMTNRCFDAFNYIKTKCIETYLDKENHDISEYIQIVQDALR